MTICLLEYGKRIPLWDAVYSEDYALVQKIMGSVDGPPQVNIPHGIWMQTSVHLAVDKANSKILKALVILNSADPNARSINGTTPLHIAVQKKRKDLVQDLLLIGANPLLQNYTGKSAIDMALELELKEITMLLRQTAGERAIDNAWKAKMTAVAAKS